MFVVKRSGKKESIYFDKITWRVEKLCYGLDRDKLDVIEITKKVINGLYDGVTTSELDSLAAEICASLALKHPDYGVLAARIAISNLHKSTEKSFSKVMEKLFRQERRETPDKPFLSNRFMETIRKYNDELDSCIIHSRDFNFDFFGIKTLEKSYLLRLGDHIVERPQHMFMRCAVEIHGDDIEKVKETYNHMAEGNFIHATPTLFNSGTPKNQMSSCFLMTIKDDSIEGIYESLKDCAKISQSAGGIGISVQHIRAKGSSINGTNGKSNGIIPMLRVFNDTARYVDQGGGKRKGAIAVYLEPWHADIFDFLDLRKNHGQEELRTRDLFTALWMNDLFMERVENNGMWSLFCPTKAPMLVDSYGEDFKRHYLHYEREGLALRQVSAQDLWFSIVNSQIETGTPYILYKDACNKKSNQKNLGTIRNSNLCAEIVEYSSAEEYAVCNLASIALPKCVENGRFNFSKLEEITSIITINLNRIIDKNYYPVPETKKSNLRNRPIGIGVQGLADVFLLMGLAFESSEAKMLNREIFETIYYAAVQQSIALAREFGPYDSFEGSPASKGLLQFDLWDIKPSERYDWKALKADLKKYGLRNSLLVAPMPTASTSQILGNNECFEPYTSNIYTRRVLSGEYIVINKHLLKDLMDSGLWNLDIKNKIIMAGGSVQNISEIPEDMRRKYKTVWEISQKSIIDMAAQRGPFVCQTQSMNLFMETPTAAKISSMHFYAWKKGLKTGMYYLRSQAAGKAVQFTVRSGRALEKVSKAKDTEPMACEIGVGGEGCEVCSS